MEPFREILMEGLSAKLKNFEDVSSNYSINMNPRQNYMQARMTTSKQLHTAQNVAKLLQNKVKHKKPKPNQNAFALSQKPQKNPQKRGLRRTNQNRQKLFHHSQNPNQASQQPFDPNALAGSSTFKKFGQTSKFNNSDYFSAYGNNNDNYVQGVSTHPNFKNMGQSSRGNPLSLNGTRNFNGEMNEPEGIDDEEETLEFRYSYDFDENGALFWLGTRGKTQNYVNPYNLSNVKVFFSSMGRGSYEDFVGRGLVNCRTLNEPNAFMGIDFGIGRYLVPSCYSIRNRDSTRHVMLNWIFEVSVFFWV